MSPALRAALCLAGLAASACAGTPSGGDAGDESVTLECAPPLSVALTASTAPPNTGVPTAAIVWTEGACALREDETDPDAVLVVADFTGIFSGSLSVATGNRWVIESSSVGSAPSNQILGLPRGVVIDMELRHRDGAAPRIAVSFQVDGDLVTLLEMRWA